MAIRLNFKNAVSASIVDLASAFNVGFKDYFYPPQMTDEVLARRVRMEHIDLTQSLLAYDGEEFVGFALFGLRGREAWCGGLGIAPKFRGRGLAQQLMSEFIARAQRCGVRKLSLEVLTKNLPAIRLYERFGMRVVRDLLILERTSNTNRTTVEDCELKEGEVDAMLRNFDGLHAWRPGWQRQFASLLSADGLHGVCLGDIEMPDAYALVFTRPDGVTQLIDLAAASARHSEALVAGLAVQYGRMRVVNEPEESLFIASLTEHGFAEVERQHEMSCDLTS